MSMPAPAARPVVASGFAIAPSPVAGLGWVGDRCACALGAGRSLTVREIERRAIVADHPAVAFLTAKVARAEETARAATPGPWFANPYDSDWDGTGHEASIGTRPDDGRWPDAAKDVVGHGYEGGGVCNLPDAVFIAAFSPDVVLRLVAGARAILAKHGLVNTTGYDAYGAASFDACRICGRNGYTPGPCQTVLLTAQAWGWTEAT